MIASTSCQAELPVPALQNIIDSNNSVREALEKGLDAVKLQENWDYLQINCAMYINSDMPGVASQSQPNTKPLRQALLWQCLHWTQCNFQPVRVRAHRVSN